MLGSIYGSGSGIVSFRYPVKHLTSSSNSAIQEVFTTKMYLQYAAKLTYINFSFWILSALGNIIDLASEIGTHLDLHVVSHSILNDNVQLLSPKYFLSIHDKIQNSSGTNSYPFVDGNSSRIALRLNSTTETLQALSRLGSTTQVKSHEIKPWLLVLWPEPVRDETSAKLTLDRENFKDSVKGFSIASTLIIAFLQNASTSNFIIFEVYHINGFQIVKLLNEGLVDFKCNNCRGIAIRRSNFHGIELNVTGIEDTEINDDLHYETISNGDLVISSEGFSAKILEILQQSLNFTVKAQKSADWGRFFKENNSWYGAVKDVADGLADFGIAITILRPDRAGLVSFFPAADEHYISAFFRPPELNAIRDIFARPFKADLWAAVFSTWFVLAFFMILFSVIRKRYDIHETTMDGEPEPDFTQDSFIWALATACQQGWDEHPVAGSLRAIFISGSFTGVVAYAGYSAAIVSTLSTRIDPIQTPEQLLRSQLRIGIRSGFISELLQQNNTHDIMTMYQSRLSASFENERRLRAADGYEHLQKHPYAFISTRDTMYDILKATQNDTTICNLRELRILKHGFPTGHFIQKNSPYKEMMRYIYVSIREPGISWKLRTNYTYARRCLEASDNSGQKLGVHDVFTAFVILSGGCVLSLTFLVIEKLYRIGRTFSYIR